MDENRFKVGDVIRLTVREEINPNTRRLIVGFNGDKYRLLYPNNETMEFDKRFVESFYGKVDEPFTLNDGTVIKEKEE